jgi:hypothetical protein
MPIDPKRQLAPRGLAYVGEALAQHQPEPPKPLKLLAAVDVLYQNLHEFIGLLNVWRVPAVGEHNLSVAAGTHHCSR